MPTLPRTRRSRNRGRRCTRCHRRHSGLRPWPNQRKLHRSTCRCTSLRCSPRSHRPGPADLPPRPHPSLGPRPPHCSCRPDPSLPRLRKRSRPPHRSCRPNPSLPRLRKRSRPPHCSSRPHPKLQARHLRLPTPVRLWPARQRLPARARRSSRRSTGTLSRRPRPPAESTPQRAFPLVSRGSCVERRYDNPQSTCPADTKAAPSWRANPTSGQKSRHLKARPAQGTDTTLHATNRG